MKDPLIEKFKSAGAESVAGSIILNRVTMAIMRNGQLMLTPEGDEFIAALNTPKTRAAAPAPEAAAPEANAPAPTPKPAKAPKAPKEAKAPAAPASGETAESLLGDLDKLGE